MSDKPVKFYTDDLGIIHGPQCPVTKAAWAKKGAPEPAKIISLRSMDAADRAEQETLLDVYKHALGMV